jgi:hypothetical protein
MKRPLLHLSLLCAFALPAATAPVPPPEKLLPADALFALTIPDYAKSSASWKQMPGALFWGDASMKPFRDKFMKKFQSDIIAPLEKELGIKFADYSGLAQGQVSLAIVAPPKAGDDVGFLLLVDGREKSDVLKTNLATLKKKWTDAGKQTRTEKIRDVEFSTLIFKSDDLGKTFDKLFPDPNAGNESLEPPKPKKATENVELMLGQSGSLVILGNNTRDIERVLAGQSGGGGATLSDNPAFAKTHAAHFRESQAYGWLHLKPLLEKLAKQAAKDNGGEGGAPPGAFPQLDKIFSALGLSAIQDLSFSLRDMPEGCAVNFNVNVPESARKGLIKAFAFEARDANPPTFVPSDAVKFLRLRLDLGKSWTTLEQSLVEAIPQVAGVLKLFLDSAGKDKDPDFDIRKQLFANLGDDLISYQKNPRKQTLDDLQNPPSLTLISSPRPEQLAASIKALAAVMPMGGGKFKEREFLGRKVYSMSLPQTQPGAKGNERMLSYAASGGYVAVSTDTPTLEEFMRSGEGTGKSLREAPGLTDAAQKVGGMGTGLFGYENSAETFKSLMEILKKDSGTLANLFSGLPMAGRLGMADDANKFKDWVDFSLLPSFDQVSKYFYITVWSGSVNSDGFSIKAFAPNPPGMKK